MEKHIIELTAVIVDLCEIVANPHYSKTAVEAKKIHDLKDRVVSSFGSLPTISVTPASTDHIDKRVLDAKLDEIDIDGPDDDDNAFELWHVCHDPTVDYNTFMAWIGDGRPGFAAWKLNRDQGKQPASMRGLTNATPDGEPETGY